MQAGLFPNCASMVFLASSTLFFFGLVSSPSCSLSGFISSLSCRGCKPSFRPPLLQASLGPWLPLALCLHKSSSSISSTSSLLLLLFLLLQLSLFCCTRGGLVPGLELPFLERLLALEISLIPVKLSLFLQIFLSDGIDCLPPLGALSHPFLSWSCFRPLPLEVCLPLEAASVFLTSWFFLALFQATSPGILLGILLALFQATGLGILLLDILLPTSLCIPLATLDILLALFQATRLGTLLTSLGILLALFQATSLGILLALFQATRLGPLLTSLGILLALFQATSLGI